MATKLIHSPDLATACESRDREALGEEADASCTAGYDNDGSTGFEIFENGVELAAKAGGKNIFYAEVENEDGPNTVLFFTAENEQAAIARAMSVDEKSEEE